MRALGGSKVEWVSETGRLLMSAALVGALILLLLILVPGAFGQSAGELDPALQTARIQSEVNSAEVTTIPGSTHPAVRHAIDNSPLPQTQPMGDLILVLRRSDAQQAALEAFNQEQYDPTSPQFHRWLTPSQFGANYGVGDSDLEAVTNWLENEGFSIDEIPPSRMSVRFSGTVGQVEAAFHTEMHSITSNGVVHVANVSDISIPTALTPVVVGVKALHNFFARPLHRTLTDARRNYAPGNGYQLLVPYDMATIYNYKSLWTASTPINGAGQTVALAGTSNIVLSDVATFRSATGLPAKTPTVIVTNSDPGTTNLLDDRMENTLDVEWSGAAAPGASIVLVTSSQTTQTTDALYASESYIVNNNVAKIMSVSYGECELGMGTAGNQEYANLWQQAYTQGIAVFVSSGDSMAAVCDDGDYNPSADYAAEFGLTVSGMTSTPYNVSVGGTDFNSTSASWSSTNSSTNMSNATGYIPELPWNDTVTNPILINNFDGQLGVNYSAEKWANWLLTNEGINSGLYEEVIPPTGGSGGVSNCTTSNGSTPSSCGGGYAKPAWQTGVTGIVSTDKRTVPDVSFFASNGFMGVTYLICDSQPPGFSSPTACSYPANAMYMAVGGTSVSSPVMAGVMALINQKAGASQGNPNSVLYGLAAKQTYGNCSAESTSNSKACYFNDVDTGTIAAVCYGGSTNCTPQTSGDMLGILPGYAATTGYDKATGLGSLNVANVVNGWPAVATTAPAVRLSTSSLTFSSTKVGSSSATQAVTLTNSGTGSMTISGVTITGSNPSSFSQTNSCGSTLAVSTSCVVTVTFKPAASGTLSAALSFADNAANSPQTVALSGTGAAVTSVAVSPSSLTFPSTTTGSASASQTVTFTNTGSTTVTFTSSPTVTGTYNTLFKGATSCAGSGSLAAGASCLTTFTFNPTAAGTFTATLSFNDTAPNSPQTVSLSGTATGAPAVTLSPASLAFASTLDGTSSAAQTVTVKNTGSGTLNITSISFIGSGAAAYAQTNACGTSLAASASCTITVTFKPTAAGAASATLSLADNATGSPQGVTVSGTGVAPQPAVQLSVASLSFPITAVNASAGYASSPAQAITLTNKGTGALTLTSIALAGTNPTSFTEMNNCPSSLAVSASCTVLASFAPTALSSRSSTLVFTDNANPVTQSVSLTGTGVSPPTWTLSTASLSYGTVKSGTTSVAQAIVVTNTSSTTPVNLTGIALNGTGAASFADASSCGVTLAASSTCIIMVEFTPKAAGASSASLVVTANNPSATATVALSGTGQ